MNSPVNDIRKYIISSIINIVIKNNNIQDIIKTTQPLIIIRTNLGIQITNLNIVMKVGILNFINAIIVSIVSLIAIINSGAKFIFNSEYEQAIIGVIATAILDRLLHHSHPFLINGPSYRMKDLLPTTKNKKQTTVLITITFLI